jgi:excinuclease ABC subunit C
LADCFALESRPERIEVYDNSHISGAHALGAMIVVGPEGFQKSSYRKFNMEHGGDDIAMMREMLTRRFKSQTSEVLHPDLILIDGGQGQLNAVQQVMADLGVSDIPVVAIAKGPDRNAGRERFFIPGKPPLSLETNDPLLYFLQRIRDEAHRFVITSHRAKRSRAIVTNPLDEVPGIGGKRKKALLLHFGSAKAVAEAGLIDLQKVDGISKAVAQKVYNFFHESSD